MIYTYPYTSKVADQDPGSASTAGSEPKPKPAGPVATDQLPAGSEPKPKPAGPESSSGPKGPTGPTITTGPQAPGTESTSGQVDAAQPIFDPVTLNEIAGYATLPILLALISALVTDKPAIPLALALAGLGAAHYIPWVKENINVMRLAEALFGGNTSGSSNPATTSSATNNSGTSAQGSQPDTTS